MQNSEYLRTLNDNKLVDNIKNNNCSDSLNILKERHQALAFDIYKKFSNKLVASGLSVNDLSSDISYVIYQAAEKFDPSKCSKFSTWFGNNIKFQCLTEISKNSKFSYIEEEELDSVIPPVERSKSDDVLDFIFTILDSLHDKRISEVFKARYLCTDFDKMSWSKVSSILNISPQTAINLHNKGLKILKGKMDSTVISDLV